jgi:RNA polymerase sigma factor (sigma-70 family)
MKETLQETVQRAQSGDRAALEEIVRDVQGRVYGVALRMLWHPEDAQDVTQEILLRVVTHLGGFRGDSKFETWVYRIAVNHLLTWRKSRMEEQGLTFEAFGRDLEEGLADHGEHLDNVILSQEIRVGCTLGMLLCLDRAHRIAYILGEILELNSNEAASVLKVGRSAFRKRLERARSQIVAFMKARCGLANAENPCRCRRRLPRAVELHRVDRKHLLFAGEMQNANAFPDVLTDIRRLEEAQRAVALFRSHPEYAVPDFTAAVTALLCADSGDGHRSG